MGLSHDSLDNYYRVNFLMMQDHKYSLNDLDNMIPWERELYVTFLIAHLEEERQRVESQNNQSK